LDTRQRNFVNDVILQELWSMLTTHATRTPSSYSMNPSHEQIPQQQSQQLEHPPKTINLFAKKNLEHPRSEYKSKHHHHRHPAKLSDGDHHLIHPGTHWRLILSRLGLEIISSSCSVTDRSLVPSQTVQHPMNIMSTWTVRIPMNPPPSQDAQATARSRGAR
jgi:hypothetical protein